MLQRSFFNRKFKLPLVPLLLSIIMEYTNDGDLY